MHRPHRVLAATDVFQHVETLRNNRAKRTRHRQFLVEGVRNLNEAIANDWQLDEVWFDGERTLSPWAAGVLEATPGARHVETTAALFARLTARDEPSEVLAVATMADDDAVVRGVQGHGALLLVVFDRPTSPGNLGSVVRSCDALGADALLVTGHAADPYDPQAVRASMGSLFSLPVARLGGPRDVLALVARLGAETAPVQIVGAGADGGTAPDALDLSGPTVLVLGNEARGLSAAYADASDAIAHIPMVGTADSLNVAGAAAILLYEVARQRRAIRGRSAGTV